MQADGSVEVCVLSWSDFLNGIPILAPGFCFTRLQKTKIRLVVGVNARHDFDVGAELAALVGVGQIAVPGITEIVIAPGPLLFAGRNVMVRYMDDAGLRPV